MSTNVTSVTVIKCTGWMRAEDVGRLLAENEGNLPASCFLHAMAERAPDIDGTISVDRDFSWTGEWSGHCYQDVLIEKVAPLIRGTVEVVFTWEGGDSHTSLRIRDGKVTEPKVVMTLADD